ncbi:hypothetical protein GCM10010430_76960 [Kitasatospora cystarginea]|uniref:Bacterioferritin n=1 Tax=Kitasatospora cystarginea TaxID=58350 RepID=A0ABN3F0Q4_9ACTN
MISSTSFWARVAPVLLRIVISTYQEIVRWLGDHDPTTRRLIESILEEEEEHADDLIDLLAS